MAEPPSLDEALRDVPAEKLDKVCSNEVLNEISKSLTHWSEVSPWLGLTEADEEEIREERSLVRQRIDVLRKWKGQQMDAATYRSLVGAFYRAQRLDLVDCIIKLLLASSAFQSASPPPQSYPFPPRCSSLTEYGEYLKELYRDRETAPTSSIQWPPVPIRKIFKLAMIQQTQIQRGEIPDKYVRLTVTGKVDDILHMKVPITLESIFQIDKRKRKVILIEGAPGSGKSTLSWDICKRWGAGELFQEFDVVILVQLRDPRVQAASTLADILPAQDKEMADSVARIISVCKGQKVLFLLDGWDELPSGLQRESLFSSLLDPGLLQNGLYNSAVIVTSRPISSVELHPLVSSRVEIVGFTLEELRQYLSECLDNDSHAVGDLLARIEENPVIESSCYLPLNAAIIVHLFLSGNQTLPTATHDIFTSLVLCCLSRYLRARIGRTGEAANLSSLDSLPKDLQKPFRKLCNLAFIGVVEDKVTFTTADLEGLGIHGDALALGLLQGVPSIISHEVTVYYNFLHLLIQELLAAYYISSLPSGTQISHFRNLFDQSRFAAVFQFYAGITHFRSKREYLSKISFLLPKQLVPTGILDIITTMIRRGDSQYLISILNCLYEADDPSLCQFVAKELNFKLDLSETTLSPLDCLSIGYFVSCAGTTTHLGFSLFVRKCSIGDHGCKFLVKGLERYFTPATTVPVKLWMCIEDNNISVAGVKHLAQILRESRIIHCLEMGGNPIGEAGFKTIAEALINNSSVTGVNLSNCSVKITQESGPIVCEMLRRSTILLDLTLSSNSVCDSGAAFLARGLEQNHSVRWLTLAGCDIGDKGVKSLADALLINKRLRSLYLQQNPISMRGSSVLLNSVKSKWRFCLKLPKHLIPPNAELQNINAMSSSSGTITTNVLKVS